LKGGQHDYRDTPESSIGPLTIYGSGSHNFQFRGPHDAHISELFSSSAGGDGARFEGDGSTYLGTADIGLIHSYAATTYGIYTNIKLKARHLQGESCTKEGIYIDTAASRTSIGFLEAFANSVGSTTYPQATIAAAECIIGGHSIDLTSVGSGSGGLVVSGANCVIGLGQTKDTNATASAIGVDLNAAGITYKGNIIDFTGTSATGLRTASGGSRADLNIEAYISNCYTGWNHVTAGNRGSYKVRINTANKDHLLFTGAGPATFDPGSGAGVRARESWDVFAANTGSAHTGTAQAGAASTITLASGASTRDDVYNGCIITTTGGTGSGQTAVITDYVGSTRVATIACVGTTAATWAVTPDNTTTYSVAALVMATKTAGVATIANGTTSIRVAHGGLITSNTPTARNVTVEFTEDPGLAIEVWPSSVDKTVIVFTVDADPGAATDIRWSFNLAP
jgi:hypothetical protein